MEGMKIIKRIVSYLVFIIAASLFLQNTVVIATSYYIDPETAYEATYLPVLYSLLTLGVTLLFQLLVVGKPKEIEKNFYPWVLIVPFAVMFFVSAFVMLQSIVTANTYSNFEPIYGIAGMIPPMILSVVEVVVGFFMLASAKKAEAPAKEEEQSEVNLTKEE